MKLLDVLSPESIRVPLESSDKRDVIAELVSVLKDAGRVPDAKALETAVWNREQTRTTGIGHGLAIPHGKSPGIPSLVMAIGKPAEPIDFESIDGQPVRLVVLIASPPDKTSEHIQALARVSRLMTIESFRDKIYAATEADEIFELIKDADGA